MSQPEVLTEQQRKQNTFDIVFKHSAQMTEQSFDVYREICMYRADHNNKCFIGACIPDEAYNQDMEGNSARDLLSEFSELENVLFSRGLTVDAYFLARLQCIHDDKSDFVNRQFKLEQLARQLELSVPAL